MPIYTVLVARGTARVRRGQCYGHSQESHMATGPILTTHLIFLVCVQNKEIMQLENLEQFYPIKSRDLSIWVAARLLIQVIEFGFSSVTL